MVNDQEVETNVIYRMLENGAADAVPGSLMTSMFTVQEIIDSMNRVQQKFLFDTGMIVTRTIIPATVGNPKYALPVDSIRPRRLTWTG